MISELFNYKISLLNPALKWIAPILFLLALILFYFGARDYGGEFKKAMNYLMISIILGILAFSFRLMGDSVISFKWGESLFFLIFAVINLIVAINLLIYVNKVKNSVKL